MADSTLEIKISARDEASNIIAKLLEQVSGFNSALKSSMEGIAPEAKTVADSLKNLGTAMQESVAAATTASAATEKQVAANKAVIAANLEEGASIKQKTADLLASRSAQLEAVQVAEQEKTAILALKVGNEEQVAISQEAIGVIRKEAEARMTEVKAITEEKAAQEALQAIEDQLLRSKTALTVATTSNKEVSIQVSSVMKEIAESTRAAAAADAEYIAYQKQTDEMSKRIVADFKEQASAERAAAEASASASKAAGEQLSGAFNGVKEKINGVSEAAGKLGGLLGAPFKAASGLVTAFEQQITYGIMPALQNMGQGIMSVGMGIESNLARFQAVGGESMKTFGITLGDVNGKVLELSRTFGILPTDAAAGMYQMVTAGLTAKETMQAAGAAAQLAASQQISMGEAAKQLVGILNEFNISAADATQVTGSMAAVANASAIEVDNLRVSLSYAGPIAGALGYSLNDVNVAIGLMGNNMIIGSKAGTAMRSILTSIADQSSKGSLALADLGIKTVDAHGNMVPFIDVMEQLRAVMNKTTDGVKEYSKADKEMLAQTIAGKTGMSGLLAIMDAAPDKFDAMVAATAKGTEANKAYMDSIEATFGYTFNKAQANIQATADVIFKNLEPALKEMFNDFNSFASSGGAIDFAAKMGTDFGELAVRVEQTVIAVVKFGQTTGILQTVSTVFFEIVSTVKNVGSTIGSVLLPALTSFSLWVGENKAAIANVFTAISTTINDLVKNYLPGLLQGFSTLGQQVMAILPNVISTMGKVGAAVLAVAQDLINMAIPAFNALSTPINIVLNLIGTLADVIANTTPIIEALVFAFAAYKAIIIGQGLIEGVAEFAGNLALVGSAALGTTAEMTAATVAAGALDIALGPIGIALAIGAAAAAAVTLSTNLRDNTQVINDMVKSLGDFRTTAQSNNEAVTELAKSYALARGSLDQFHQALVSTTDTLRARNDVLESSGHLMQSLMDVTQAQADKTDWTNGLLVGSYEHLGATTSDQRAVVNANLLQIGNAQIAMATRGLSAYQTLAVASEQFKMSSKAMGGASIGVLLELGDAYGNWAAGVATSADKIILKNAAAKFGIQGVLNLVGHGNDPVKPLADAIAKDSSAIGGFSNFIQQSITGVQAIPGVTSLPIKPTADHTADAEVTIYGHTTSLTQYIKEAQAIPNWSSMPVKMLMEHVAFARGDIGINKGLAEDFIKKLQGVPQASSDPWAMVRADTAKTVVAVGSDAEKVAAYLAQIQGAVATIFADMALLGLGSSSGAQMSGAQMDKRGAAQRSKLEGINGNDEGDHTVDYWMTHDERGNPIIGAKDSNGNIPFPAPKTGSSGGSPGSSGGSPKSGGAGGSGAAANTSPLDELSKQADAMSKIAEAFMKVDASTAPAKANVDKFMSMVEYVMKAFEKVATDNKKTLDSASAYVDVALKVADLVDKGTTAFKSLQDYVGPTNDAMAQFANGITIMVKKFVDIAKEFDIKGLAGAMMFSEAAAKVLDITARVQDLKALTGFISPTTESMAQFSNAVLIMVEKFQGDSYIFNAKGLAGATAFADAAGKVLDTMAKFKVLQDIAGFVSPTNDVMAAVSNSILIMVEKFQADSYLFNVKGLASATLFGETAGKILDAVSKVTTLTLLQDYTSLPDATMDTVVANVRDLVLKFQTAANTFAAGSLTGTTVFAGAVTAVFAGLDPAIKTLTSLKDFMTLGDLNDAMDSLIADVHVMVQKMQTLANTLGGKDAFAAAEALGKASSSIFDGLSKGLSFFLALGGGGKTTDKTNAKGQDSSTTVEPMDIPALLKAAGGNLEALMSAITSSLQTFAKLPDQVLNALGGGQKGTAAFGQLQTFASGLAGIFDSMDKIFKLFQSFGGGTKADATANMDAIMNGADAAAKIVDRLTARVNDMVVSLTNGAPRAATFKSLMASFANDTAAGLSSLNSLSGKFGNFAPSTSNVGSAVGAVPSGGGSSASTSTTQQQTVNLKVQVPVSLNFGGHTLTEMLDIEIMDVLDAHASVFAHQGMV